MGGSPVAALRKSAYWYILNSNFIANLQRFNLQLFNQIFGSYAQVADFFAVVAFKLVAIPAIMLALFLIYWLLPNGKVDIRRIVTAAILIGLLLEVLKWVNVLLWPFLSVKLDREYGPFIYSVTIILWSFFASMLMLGGAEWAARDFANGNSDVLD